MESKTSAAGHPGVRARRGLLSALAPFAGIAAAALILYAIPPHAAVTLLDLRTVAVHTVIVATAAMGMTLIIISGGIDLSVGSAVALTSVAAALAMKNDAPVAVAILIALAAGALCGLYNGILITALRLPPFIATLGTLGFFRGVAKWVSDSRPISAPTRGLDTLVQPIPEPAWFIVAPAVWLTATLALVMVIVLRWTVFGRRAVAIGSNPEAAHRCGIPVNRTKIAVYTVAGILTGLAGLLQFARLTQGDPTVAAGLELDVIAAVVIGGASLAGGQGSIVGTIAGAFLMAYLRNRCTVLGWSNFIQEMIIGHIIIGAVALDQWRLRRTR